VLILILPLEAGYLFLKFIFIAIITAFLILKPKDDLAIDKNTMYHIQRSVYARFTKIDRYELSKLTAIRVRGVHTDKWEIVDLVNGAGGNGGSFNTIEMTFSDGTSKSLQLAISREQIDKVIEIADELKAKMAS
ncbi:MAG: hypothetical protein AAFO69_03550, partial [Bacteroidota bacterium]